MQKTVIYKTKNIYIANNILVNFQLSSISVEHVYRIQFDTRN